MAISKINAIPRYTKDIINADWIDTGKLEAYGNVRTIYLRLKNNMVYTANQPYVFNYVDQEDTPKNGVEVDIALYQGVCCRAFVNSANRQIGLYMASNVTITNAVVCFSYIV